MNVSQVSSRGGKSRSGGKRLTVWISEKTMQQLDALKQAAGSESVDEVISEAIALSSRFRMGEEAESFGQLSPRLREVLLLIAEGHTTKQIGQKLHISVKTVEMHRTQLVKVLGIQGIARLVRFAIRAGVVLP
jgi:DNA-binding NarL/FixJ family response regulator